MKDPLAKYPVDVPLYSASSFCKKFCSEVSQVNAGKENVVDDVLEPIEREVNRSRPHDNSSLNVRVEDVSRERSIFLEEEYQKSIMHAKENGDAI